MQQKCSNAWFALFLHVVIGMLGTLRFKLTIFIVIYRLSCSLFRESIYTLNKVLLNKRIFCVQTTGL